MIDFEALTLSWLAADPITAAVSGRQPDRFDVPWARLHLIAAVADQRSPALDHATALVQADCYAGATGGQPQAFDLADAVARRLHAMRGAHDLGVVSSVTGLTVRRVPDTDLEPARERYIVEATIYGHRRPDA